MCEAIVMDFPASGGCPHQPIHQVPWRSSVSSEHSSKFRFSGFFSFVPAGAHMFRVGMLALLLTLPWNPPSAYAWNFSNDGIPPPPIVMGLDAASASPPALPSDGLLAAPPEIPPSPSLAPTSTTLVATTSNSWTIFIVVFFLVAFIVGICILNTLCWRKVSRRPLRIFISHARDLDGRGETCLTWLNKTTKSRLSSKYRVKIFLAPGDCPHKTVKELARFDVGIVVVTKEYFSRKGPMIELIAFMEAQKKDPVKIRILPLFHECSPEELKVHLDEGTWEESWKEMARGSHPIEVEKCREAVMWLCNARGMPYYSQRQDFDKLNVDTVCKEIEILWKEGNFASNLTWVTGGFSMTCIDIEKRRRRGNPRTGKEIGVMIYVHELLRLLFAFSGLLIILLSVILDNSFNDQPVRFTAFAILAPVTIFLGFLVSGWFPRIPLHFIAFVKRHGFLQWVVPCSPWHDNVVTNYCGEVCALEPLEQAEETRLFELPMSFQNFLYGYQIFPQGTIATATTHSTFDSEIQEFQVATSVQGTIATATTHSTFDSEIQDFQVATLVQEGQDLQGQNTWSEMFDFAPASRILKCSHSKVAIGPASSPNLHEVPPRGEDIVVEIDPSCVFHILSNERVEFDGPEINGFPLKVHTFKNTLAKDHTFDLSCTFRSKKTRRMYLTTGRLQNLVQNICQWVENPYPIVVDKSSDILHCMAIEDILWEFTKTVYSFKPVHVEHRFLAGLGQIKFLFVLSFVIASFALSLIPLISDKKSYYFLFFLFVLAPYLIASHDTNPLTLYRFKSLLCPICVKIFGFSRLYKSRSSFRWCNEFRKKRIVNPSYFWIDQEYANTFPDRASCFDVCGFPEFSGPPKGQSFTMSCQGWLQQMPGLPPICEKQHDYKLQVKFDAVKLMKDVNCYTNVTLAFFENDDLLGDFNYSAVEVQRLDFIEKLFHCFSDPSFGGYVEKICSTGYCSATFVAHCPRFIDICHKICCSNAIPKLLVASRMPGSKLVVGVPFWSSEL